MGHTHADTTGMCPYHRACGAEWGLHCECEHVEQKCCPPSKFKAFCGNTGIGRQVVLQESTRIAMLSRFDQTSTQRNWRRQCFLLEGLEGKVAVRHEGGPN
eukprot:2758194-Amphidinium_carterae.1